MPFGLTYAEFVIGIGLAMFFGPNDSAPQQRQNALTLGTAVQPWVGPGDENFITYTHRREGLVWGKFTPIYSFGLSDDGTAFVSAGLGRPLNIWGVKVLPFTGPALYYDNNNNDLLQFRTGFDITQNLGENLSLSGGYYHISNGQANAPSADIDVAHLGIKLRF
ncbi:MAG: hypothetical protein U5N55_04155 [Cypionkella sp.]|nr:hypothetical protein [Cypionkella sp.]